MGTRTWRMVGVGRRWLRRPVLAISVCLTAGGAGAEPACELARTNILPAYSVGCGGKSECLASDLLEIKPQDPKVPRLASVCLRLDDTGAGHQLPNPPAAASAAALSHALAPMLHRWKASRDLGPALPAAANARLYVTAVLTDEAANRFNVPFSIDLTSLWTSGELQLKPSAAACRPHPCSFTGDIELTVPHLANWKQATKTDPNKLLLSINGNRLAGVAPETGASGADGVLRYRLRRVDGNAENAATWSTLLGRALGGDPVFQVGLADDKGVLVHAEHMLTFALPGAQARGGVTLAVGLGLLLVAAVAGSKTKWRLLRDNYGVPDAVVPMDQRTFSLGRCQMAWWTFVILVSWFAITFATGNWMPINESALVLMGISVGTAAGAVAATPPKVAQRVTELDDTATAGAARAALQGDGGLRSKSLLQDLLSDYGESTGLHRLQVVAFTLGFGAVYLWQSFHEGAMPTLSTTALALMGISGSAYVGFKLAGK